MTRWGRQKGHEMQGSYHELETGAVIDESGAIVAHVVDPENYEQEPVPIAIHEVNGQRITEYSDGTCDMPYETQRPRMPESGSLHADWDPYSTVVTIGVKTDETHAELTPGQRIGIAMSQGYAMLPEAPMSQRQADLYEQQPAQHQSYPVQDDRYGARPPAVATPDNQSVLKKTKEVYKKIRRIRGVAGYAISAALLLGATEAATYVATDGERHLFTVSELPDPVGFVTPLDGAVTTIGAVGDVWEWAEKLT